MEVTAVLEVHITMEVLREVRAVLAAVHQMAAQEVMAAQVTALAVIQEVTAVQVTPQAVIQEITAILVMLHMMVETTAAQVVVIQAAQIMVVQITQAVTAAMERQAVILLKY